MDSASIWLVLGLTGLAYEGFTLRNREDRHYPLTYHLRRVFSRTWVKVLGIGFWVWLPLHLLGVLP